jgi:hypothetical protein
MAVNFIGWGNWNTRTKLRPDRQEPNLDLTGKNQT